MYRLKPLSRDAIPGALKKAERYRLLNEAWEAESICRDVLEIDPEHQEALVTLLLALTDQIGSMPGAEEAAHAIVPRLESEYRRSYYEGIIWERRAMRLLDSGAPGSGNMVYDRLRKAMEYYEQAERLRPPGEDDPLLRWNTCARMLMSRKDLGPAPADERQERVPAE